MTHFWLVLPDLLPIDCQTKHCHQDWNTHEQIIGHVTQSMAEWRDAVLKKFYVSTTEQLPVKGQKFAYWVYVAQHFLGWFSLTPACRTEMTTLWECGRSRTGWVNWSSWLCWQHLHIINILIISWLETMYFAHRGFHCVKYYRSLTNIIGRWLTLKLSLRKVSYTWSVMSYNSCTYLDFMYYVHALNDLPKDNMFSIQPGKIDQSAINHWYISMRNNTTGQ